MRILFFADNFPPEVNAPATHIYERCRWWVDQGHCVTVVTCAPNFPEGKLYPGYRNALRAVDEMDGIRVVRVWTYIAANEGFLRRTIDYASYVPSATWAALREARPDVVISSSPQLMVPLAGMIYSMFRRRPHVFELRDLWPASAVATSAMKEGSLYRLLERLEMMLYRRATRVLSFTNSFRDDLVRRGIAADKIDVVYGGASCDLQPPNGAGTRARRDEEIERRLGLSGRFVVGYVGTLGLAHGLENVLSAAELLRDSPIVFVLVGAGAAKAQLEAAADSRGLENVIFVPRQPKSEVARYWSVCDAALVHLRDDPVFSSVVPSKIFEAMAMRKPVVFAGPEGEATELIRRHDVGLTVAPARPDLLADALRGLAADEDLCGRLQRQSGDAARHYSRRRQAEATLQVLRKAVEATAGVHRQGTPSPAAD